MTKKDSNGPEKQLSPAEVQRLVAEAQARGEDPLPIVKRAVLETIDALARRLPETPDDENE